MNRTSLKLCATWLHETGLYGRASQIPSVSQAAQVQGFFDRYFFAAYGVRSGISSTGNLSFLFVLIVICTTVYKRTKHCYRRHEDIRVSAAFCSAWTHHTRKRSCHSGPRSVYCSHKLYISEFEFTWISP